MNHNLITSSAIGLILLALISGGDGTAHRCTEHHSCTKYRVQHYTVCCGFLCWSRCGRTRTESYPSTCSSQVCCYGWTGFDCSEPVCTPSCQHGGKCIGPYTCTCPSEYEGTTCQRSACEGAPCQHGGTCVSHNNCSCTTGYTGSSCSTPICTAPCQNGGSCVAPDTCTCPPTHVGPVCETRRIVAAVTDFIDQYNVSDVVAGHLERLLSTSDTNHGNESLLHCVDDNTCTAIGHKICVPPMIELGQQHCRSFCKFCVSNLLAEPDACMTNAADVVFVVDASGSVGLGNFDKVKTFLKKTVSHLNIDQNHTRVALIEFSSQVTLMFHLNDFTDITNLMSGIDNMTYSGGGTVTSDAIEIMRGEGFAGERPMIPDVAVIITDGLSKYPTLTRRQADHAKDEGITMFVVGIGNETDHQEVRFMACDDNDLFEVDDYGDLEGIHLDVAKGICKVILPPNYHPRVLSTPPTTPHECVDMLSICSTYARDSCSDFEAYARHNCPKTCGYCPGETLTEPPCVDTLDNCEAFGTVMCLEPKYMDWVMDYCRKTCGVCGSKKDLWTTVPTTTTTTARTAAPVPCKDEDQNCQEYDADLCTNPAFSNFRQVSCRKYCGLCYVTRQIPSTTVNSHKCPSWKLPVECTLEDHPTQCCPTPKCPQGYRLGVRRL